MSRADDEVRALLAAAVSQEPPGDLASRVSGAAMATRPAGRPIDALGGGRRADAVGAYVDTVAELITAVHAAADDAIVQPYNWSVAQLLAHLLGIERYFGRQLGLWSADVDTGLEDDHLAMTAAAVNGTSTADRSALFQEWRSTVGQVCDHLRSLDADGLRSKRKFHFLDTRLSTILVVRVFELWTHTEDVLRASGATPPRLDAPRLRLMTETAVAAIPLGLLLAGIDADDVTARLVLTGSGGGVWNQPLRFGAEVAEPALTIVADAFDFCRLAAQRIDPAELGIDVEGHPDIAQRVLRGASVFAA